MKLFIVEILPLAAEDIERLSDIIRNEYKMPDTAFKYVQGLLDSIQSLKQSASVFRLQTNPAIVRAYGPFVRRINYKKMAILFIIHHQTVYIIRVIPQSAINDIQLPQ